MECVFDIKIFLYFSYLIIMLSQINNENNIIVMTNRANA